MRSKTSIQCASLLPTRQDGAIIMASTNDFADTEYLSCFNWIGFFVLLLPVVQQQLYLS
jgi:hypothetical protein